MNDMKVDGKKDFSVHFTSPKKFPSDDERISGNIGITIY